MTGRPILFSPAMACALLEGRKSQTRRMVEPQPQPNGGKGLHPVEPYHTPQGKWTWVLSGTGMGDGTSGQYCRYGEPGDVLWVKEAWRTEPKHDKLRPSEISPGSPILHSAGTGLTFPSPLWGRSRHGRYMPRWASRLTLELTDVRVERLQAITEADAIAEGIEPVLTGAGERCGWLDYEHTGPGTGYYLEAVNSYDSLWESIHGAGSWEANPWVWVLTFKVHRGNIDRLSQAAGSEAA